MHIWKWCRRSRHAIGSLHCLHMRSGCAAICMAAGAHCRCRTSRLVERPHRPTGCCCKCRTMQRGSGRQEGQGKPTPKVQNSRGQKHTGIPEILEREKAGCLLEITKKIKATCCCARSRGCHSWHGCPSCLPPGSCRQLLTAGIRQQILTGMHCWGLARLLLVDLLGLRCDERLPRQWRVEKLEGWE